MERQVVCRIFTDHLPTVSATVGGNSLPPDWARHGVHGRAVCCTLAASGWRVPFCAPLGWSTCRRTCGPGDRFSRVRDLPYLQCGAVIHHHGGSALSERTALPVRVVSTWHLALVSERRRTHGGCGCGTPRYLALRFAAIRPSSAMGGAKGPPKG